MKKIVRQQNYLKELIESQSNRFLTKQALKCVIRAVLEPLLDNPEEGVVLHRISDKSGVLGLIKRLEFSEIQSFDYSDEAEILKEKVWANTEFIAVLTHRFVAIILWDNNTDSKNLVRYYSIYNSKLQNEALDIIDRNSTVSLKEFQEHFKPDRRDNILLNASIRRLLDNMDEATKDAVLGYATVQSENEEEKTEAREVAHEIKNQLSICDLYAEILRKYCDKNEIENKTILNAANCISRAVKMASNSLVTLKSTETNNLKQYNLKEIISTVEDLTKVYFECKNVKYIVENNVDMNILVDENKFIAVLINLVKNGIEAFGAEAESVRSGKYIKIQTEKEGDFAKITVSNNAGEITNPENIFEKGITTKSGGSGLGLYICKKSIEELGGQIRLESTSKNVSKFSIRIGLV